MGAAAVSHGENDAVKNERRKEVAAEVKTVEKPEASREVVF